MKKVLSIAGALLLLIGGAVSTSIALSNEKALEAKATEYTRPTYTGLFERIEDGSEVTPGTQVIIATCRGYVFDGVGGNPAYAHADPGGVTMFPSYDSTLDYDDQDDTKFLYLHNKTAVMLTAEAGSSAYDSSLGYVSFKSEFIIGGTHKYNHYLGENNEQRTGEWDDYETIAWFLDDFGIRKAKDGKSTWELQYDSENKRMKMRKVLYNDTTSYLCYDYNGARHHFNFGPLERAWINLYRPVDNEDLVRSISPALVEDPTKTEYVKGDRIEYDGAIASYKINHGGVLSDDYYLKYDGNTSCLFSSPITVYENTTAYVKIFNTLQYTFAITIKSTASGYRYDLQNSLQPDLRGSYLFCTHNGHVRILDASVGPGYESNVDTTKDEDIFSDGYLIADSEKLDGSVLKIVRTEIDGSYYYHAMDYKGEYICIGNDLVSGTSDEYYLDHTNTATVSNAITVTANSLKIGDYYLCETVATTKKLVCFSKVQQSMVFFKLSSSTASVSSQVSEFITYFENETKVCENADEDENPFDKVSDELWSNIETEFNKLSCDAQGIFASTTYVHGTEALATKENVVDRYDYIISKYHKKDFMLRQLANTYEDNYSSSPLLKIRVNNSVPIIIATVSVVIIATTLCVIVIKKKKARS